jgi:polar amino acid transport system substrate-binding protein
MVKMRKGIAFFLVAASLLLTPFGALAQTKITVGTDIWPPYEFTEGPENNRLTGFSTEVVRAVFQRMNVEIAGDVQLYPFARLERLVLTGEIDAIYSIAFNESRDKCCHFPAEPIINSLWVLFIRKEDEGVLKFSSFEDLKGKRIGVVRGYTYSPEFWRFLETQRHLADEATNDEQNFRKLVRERVHFVAADYANATALLKKLQLTDKVVPLMQNPIRSTPLHIIFNKKNISKKFVDDFSMQLKAFKTTAEYREIYKKYF